MCGTNENLINKTKQQESVMAASKEKEQQLFRVTRRRDNSNVTFVYVCVKGVNGKTISTKVPLDTPVELDGNVIKSINRKTDMVRVPAPKDKSKGETLVAKQTFLVEKA